MIKAESDVLSIKNNYSIYFEPELINDILEVGNVVNVQKDDLLIDVNDDILSMPFIMEGALKVSRQGNDDDEILLYYIEAGETCSMTMQCCTKSSKSEIRATALENSKILMVPVMYMEKWMAKYSSWRRFILDSYHIRMTELMETIDAIAFLKLDERIKKYLSDQAKLLGTLELNYTHQQIAEDLHSSRVVISRLLKQMELQGLIKQKRNRIILSSF